jgi:hypothetical protein
VRWLVTEGALEESVAEDAEGEDCKGEEVAAVVGIAACEFSDYFVVVFCYYLVVALAVEEWRDT